MKQRMWIGLALVTLVAVTVSVSKAQKADKKGEEMAMMKPVTITGTLIDTKCYSMMPAANKPNDHMTEKGKMVACATACANMGIPVGVLQDDGNVIVLLAPAASFSAYMAQTVRVTGTKAIDGHGLIVQKAEAKNAKGKWEEIEIVTMM